MINAELERQHAKWGEQNHPIVPSWIWVSFPGSELTNLRARTACSVLVGISESEAKATVDADAERGEESYASILREETAEMVAAAAQDSDETSDEVLAEAVQTAAVAQSIVEAVIRRRQRP